MTDIPASNQNANPARSGPRSISRSGPDRLTEQQRELLGMPWTGPVPGYQAKGFFALIPNPIVRWLVIFLGLMLPILGFYQITGYFDAAVLTDMGRPLTFTGHVQHVWYEALQIAIIAYIIVGGEWMRQGIARDIATLSPRLGLTDEGRLANTIRGVIAPPSRGRFILAGAIAAFVAPIMAVPVSQSIPYDGFVAILWLRLPAMLFFISLMVINYISYISRYIRLIDEVAIIRLPDLSGFGAVGQTGLRGAGFLFFGVAAAMPFLLDDRTLQATSVILILLFIMSLLALAAPLAGLRGRIRCDKTLLLTRLDCEIADLAALAGLDSEGQQYNPDPKDGDRLSQLIAYRSVIENTPEWLIDIDTGFRYMALLVVPFGTWLASALAEQVIDRLIGG